MDFDNTAPYISNDDVQARIDELKELLGLTGESNEQTTLTCDNESERDELETLCAFQAECERSCSDWAYGAHVIHEDAFVEHITQLIDECYDIPQKAGWPYHHMTMNYTAAAEDAKCDYTEIDLDGQTYYAQG